jgi:hypothetical protein
MEEYGITWPTFLDSRDGPIYKNWNIRSWPSVYVLDAQGVIRYRGPRGTELKKAVQELLK